MDYYKEVNFEKYCKLCKHCDKEEKYDPCNDCLDYGWNTESIKPLYFESADKAKEKEQEEEENGRQCNRKREFSR